MVKEGGKDTVAPQEWIPETSTYVRHFYMLVKITTLALV